MAQRYQQQARRGGYYGYPPSYAYYPTQNYPHGGAPKKNLMYPGILVLAGLLLIGYSFVQVETLDPQIARISAIDPEMEIAAVVFCDPCSAVDGDALGAGRILVVDEVVNIRLLSDMPGVKQVRMVGKI